MRLGPGSSPTGRTERSLLVGSLHCRWPIARMGTVSDGNYKVTKRMLLRRGLVWYCATSLLQCLYVEAPSTVAPLLRYFVSRIHALEARSNPPCNRPGSCIQCLKLSPAMFPAKNTPYGQTKTGSAAISRTSVGVVRYRAESWYE